MFGKLGVTELLVILGIALLLFGKRLPQVGKSLGEGLRNFKNGLGGGSEGDATPDEAPVAKKDEAPRGQTARLTEGTSNHANTANGTTTGTTNETTKTETPTDRKSA